MSQQSRAVVARELGLPVSVEQIKVQSPRHGEVMIRLAACGVCHSDLSATNGTIAYPLPLVLGHEGAGIVTAVGEGVSRYAIGDHVVSSFVSICGRCHYCQTGRPHLCVQSLQALYTLPDGSVRIGIGAPDGKWAFEVWGQNLADKGYFQVGFDAPFQGLAVPGFNNQIDSFVGDPRTFGATIRVKF